MALLIVKGEAPILRSLRERDAKSACNEAALDEDLIDLKHLVSFA